LINQEKYLFVKKNLLSDSKEASDIATSEISSFSGENFLQFFEFLKTDPEISPIVKREWANLFYSLIYEVRPPTPEEFLTPRYLGSIGDHIYPHVKKTFLEFMNPLSGKRILVLASCIGWGKSFLSTIIALYIITHLSYMKNPKNFFMLNEAGSFVVSLLSFTKEKTSQNLLQPFANVLKASPIFHKTLREDRLKEKQDELTKKNKEFIAYTSAGRMGSFQFSKDIHVIVQSDRAALLGLNIIFGVASEISFWIKKGFSVDEIWGTFNDLRERVNSRFFNRYLTGVVLDSSPLDLSLSPIDRWIFSGEAAKDPEVMIVNQTHWDVFPIKYPIWRKTGETFPIFRGNAAKPPKILDIKEVSNYATEDIINVPIDKLQSFRDNLKKQVADYAAWPAGGLSKIIDDMQVVEDIFTPKLKNIYSYITAPATSMPERLIWNKIVNEFFIKLKNEKYEFYRSPKAPRALHIDLAESGDLGGISMCHLETGKDQKNYIIVECNVHGKNKHVRQLQIDCTQQRS
jgi:hypothetical protein